MIHPADVATTCAQCHPGAGPQLITARIHVGPGFGEHWLVRLIRRFYIVLIVVTIGAMVAHNSLDYLARLRENWRAQRRGGGHAVQAPSDAVGRTFERVTVNERWQHAVLLVSFTVLVVTGFALKFPESWWAAPLVAIEGGYNLRAWTHRIAGLVLCAVGAYHLVYLLGTARGRAQLGAVAPRLADVVDAGRQVAFNLGLRASRPRFGRFTYGEKLEYWAVVWGTVIMAVTGFLMWFQTPVLARLPLWVLDVATVIHYYEAWLATLAIIIWHLYSVVFRTDVYPMNWTWLSGRLTGPQMAEEHPAELDAILQAEEDRRAPSPPGPGRAPTDPPA
jgi:cytochrome b subunit of formate dehydrogenase